MRDDLRLHVLVIGATGAQGGSVARALVSDGTFAVRAFTRNRKSSAAAALAANGALVFEGSLANKASLEAALSGTTAVFAITDAASNSDDEDLEVEQGKLLAACAVAAGVQRLIFSSGPRIPGCSMGNAKWRLERHFRTLPLENVSFWPGFYFSNLYNYYPPRLAQDGTAEFCMPLFSSTCLFPSIAAETDIGVVVLALLKLDNFGEFRGRAISLAAEELTLPEMAEIYQRVTGQRAQHVALPDETFDYTSSQWNALAVQMNREGGYLGAYGWGSLPWRTEGTDPCEPVRRLAKMTTFEEWLRTTGFDIRKPEWQERLVETPWRR